MPRKLPSKNRLKLMPLEDIIYNIRLLYDREGMTGVSDLRITGMFGDAKITLRWNPTKPKTQ